MNVTARMTGMERLQKRFIALEDSIRTSKVVRRGASEAVSIVARAQKSLAPIRKGRLSVRALNKAVRKKKGKLTPEGLAKATKKATREHRKFRSIPLVDGVRPAGPRTLIKPGSIRRSIGSRVIVRKAFVTAKAGMNVGKKKSNPNYAYHATIVGSMRHKERYTHRRMKHKPDATSRKKPRYKKAYRGIMPDNTFILDAFRMTSRSALNALNRAVKADMATVATGGSVR